MEAGDRTAAFDRRRCQGKRRAARSEAGDGLARIDREVLAPAQANLGADPAVLAEAVADVHGSDAGEHVAVAVFDVQVEARLLTFFGVGVFVEREILGIGFRPDAEAAEILLVGRAAAQRQREAVPAGGVDEVDVLGDQLARGIEGGVASGRPRPGAPGLALGPPVETELDEVGGQDFLGLGLGILDVRRGEGHRYADGAQARTALDPARDAEALGAEAVGVGLVLVGVEIDFLQPGAGVARLDRGVAAAQGAGDGVHAGRQRKQRAARMVRQQLLVQVDEAFAAGLGDEGVAQRGAGAQRPVEGVEDLGLDRDQARLCGRAATGIDVNIAGGHIGAGVDHVKIRRVRLHGRLVDRAQDQCVGVDDSEPLGPCEQRVEPHAQARSGRQVGRAVDAEAGVGRGRGIDRDDQIARRADVQAGDTGAGQLARIQRAVGHIDVETAVGVGDRAGQDAAARDVQPVCAGAERNVAGHEAVFEVQGVGARAEANGADQHGLVRIRHSVAVSVGIGRRGRAGLAILAIGDARGVGGDVDRRHRAGERGAGRVGGQRRRDGAGVLNRGQGARLVADRVDVGNAAARRGQDRAIVEQDGQVGAGRDVDARRR